MQMARQRPGERDEFRQALCIKQVIIYPYTHARTLLLITFSHHRLLSLFHSIIWKCYGWLHQNGIRIFWVMLTTGGAGLATSDYGSDISVLAIAGVAFLWILYFWGFFANIKCSCQNKIQQDTPAGSDVDSPAGLVGAGFMNKGGGRKGGRPVK